VVKSLYEIECEVCETEVEVLVGEPNNEEPAFCPMCGSPVEAK
jgi:rRNA maturation endonuclease Nob1